MKRQPKPTPVHCRHCHERLLEYRIITREVAGRDIPVAWRPFNPDGTVHRCEVRQTRTGIEGVRVYRSDEIANPDGTVHECRKDKEK